MDVLVTEQGASSLEQPVSTDTANTHGILTVLKASVDAGVERVVHAFT
jgi:nucleoside-diphosphate-sugar epimerase